MIFTKHSNLEGLHAPFSPSQPYWLRYDDDKAIDIYKSRKAAERGTILHAWAKSTIDLGIKQPRSKQTLYSYVNDAIGFKMQTEVVLKYSDRFFGTVDAICFRNNKLRIHDLKTGANKAKMEQLYCYVALFCLEYKLKPGDLDDIECRLYQNDQIEIAKPTAENILPIMDQIIHLDEILEEAEKAEVYS